MCAWNAIRRNSQRLSAIGVFAVVMGNTVPQVWGVPFIQRRLQLRRDSEVVKLPPDTYEFCMKVVDDMDLPDESGVNLDFFQTWRPWLESHGGLQNSIGGIVGLPVSFNCDEVNVETEKIGVEHETVKGTVETIGGNDSVPRDGKRIHDRNNSGKSISAKADADSQIDNNVLLHQDVNTADKDTPVQTETEFMRMSDNAKKYAIARALYGLNTRHLWIENGSALGIFIGCYWFGSLMRVYGGLKLWARVSVYGSLGMVGVLSYSVLISSYHKRRQRQVDEQAMRLGKDYSLGAVEFYEKFTVFEEQWGSDEKSLWARFRSWTVSFGQLPASARLYRVRELLKEIETVT